MYIFYLLQRSLCSGAASTGAATELRSLRRWETLALDQLTIPCLHLVPEKLKNIKLTQNLRPAWSNGNGGASLV